MSVSVFMEAADGADSVQLQLFLLFLCIFYFFSTFLFPFRLTSFLKIRLK